MAVNVTGVPVHTVVALALIETDATTLDCTIIAMEFDVGGEPVAQLELDVMIQVTTSPLFIVKLVKVAEFVPAFTPFTCH